MIIAGQNRTESFARLLKAHLQIISTILECIW